MLSEPFLKDTAWIDAIYSLVSKELPENKSTYRDPFTCVQSDILEKGDDEQPS